MNASAMMVKGSTARFPKSHSTFSFANKFHERMVEKAKNNRQMATNQAPRFSPKNCPKASWAMLVLVMASAVSVA